MPVKLRCHDIHALFNGVFVGRFFILRAKRTLISTECRHVFVLSHCMLNANYFFGLSAHLSENHGNPVTAVRHL
jgi:hypothetical protein